MTRSRRNPSICATKASEPETVRTCEQRRRWRRDVLVCWAMDAGFSSAFLADVFGLTPPRVRQIFDEKLASKNFPDPRKNMDWERNFDGKN